MFGSNVLSEREESYIAGKRDQMSLKSSKLSLFLKKVTLSIAARSESPICQDNISSVDKDFQTWSVCCLATQRHVGPTWAWPLNLFWDQASQVVGDRLGRKEGSLRPWAHCPSPSRLLPRYLKLIKHKQRKKGKQGEKQREREKGNNLKTKIPGMKGVEKKNQLCLWPDPWPTAHLQITTSQVVGNKKIFILSQRLF